MKEEEIITCSDPKKFNTHNAKLSVVILIILRRLINVARLINSQCLN